MFAHGFETQVFFLFNPTILRFFRRVKMRGLELKKKFSTTSL